jgi:endoglucanase
MDDWPFLWGENEYVIDIGATYIFLAHAAHEVCNAGSAKESARTCTKRSN